MRILLVGFGVVARSFAELVEQGRVDTMQRATGETLKAIRALVSPNLYCQRIQSCSA